MRANAPACLTDGDNRLADGVRQLDLFFPFGVEEEGSLQVLWEDGERVICRGWRQRADGHRLAVLAVAPAVAMARDRFVLCRWPILAGSGTAALEVQRRQADVRSWGLPTAAVVIMVRRLWRSADASC